MLLVARRLALFALLVSAIGSRASAAPIGLSDIPIAVDFTVSGGPGNWLLDFAVTNRFSDAANPDMGIYLFGVLLPEANMVVGSPYAFVPTRFDPATSYLPHNNRWIVDNLLTSNTILPGDTRSGFLAIDRSEVAPTHVPWFAFAFSNSYTPYAGDPGLGIPINPGYQSPDSPAVTPEPGSLLLLGTGVAGLLAVRRVRRGRRNLVL